MNEREKIEQIYQKSNVKVSKEYIDNIMKDAKRVQMFMERYEQEKIESMNYIFNKPDDNKNFTKFELEAMNKINLFDRKMVKLCKIIWDNKDNPEQLEKFEKQIQEELKKRGDNK